VVQIDNTVHLSKSSYYYYHHDDVLLMFVILGLYSVHLLFSFYSRVVGIFAQPLAQEYRIKFDLMMIIVINMAS